MASHVNQLEFSHSPGAEDLYEDCLQNIEKACALTQVACCCTDGFANLNPHAFYHFFLALGDFLELAKTNLIRYAATSSQTP